jgi:hypothetical protein
MKRKTVGYYSVHKSLRVERIAIWLRIKEFACLNPVQVNGYTRRHIYTISSFLGFLSSFRQMQGIYLKLGRKWSVTSEFFLSHLLSLYVTIYTLAQKSLDNRVNMLIELYRHNPPHGATAPSAPGSPHDQGFTITLRHITLGRTPLDEWSARRRDLYLITHNIHRRQTSMPTAGIEIAIPASERPQTHALGRVATGIGFKSHYLHLLTICKVRRFSLLHWHTV